MNRNDLLELAKKVEIWLSTLRYEGGKINNDISIVVLHELDECHSEKKIYSDTFGIIKYWISEINKKGYETPEEIKNRILLIETFRQNEWGCTPKY